MNKFDFSGKTCPEGFTYVPAQISEYLKNRRFDHATAKKALKAVGRLIAEHNAQQACFGDFALFSLSMLSKDQVMTAKLTTVAAKEDPMSDDGRFEKVLDGLIGRIETELKKFYNYDVAFDIHSSYFLSRLEYGNSDAIFNGRRCIGC